MTRLVATQSFDMSTWDVTDVANAVVVAHSSTKASLFNGTTQYIYLGTGFTFNGSNHPTGGTVTSFGIWDRSGATPVNELEIKGLNIDFTVFDSYVQAHDTDGLFAAIFAGDDTLIGSAGNDVLLGYDGNDGFNLGSGGSDTAVGGIGDDTFNMAGSLNAGDRLDGGAGADTVKLKGATTVTFDADTIKNIEKIVLTNGASYSLTLNAGNLSAGQVLTVNGSQLHGANSLTVDGSAITAGNLVLIGGAGDDVLTGGATATTFKLLKGGADTATGGAGNDKFVFDDSFNAADTVDGGGGVNTLVLNGYASSGAGIADDFGVNSLTFLAGTLTHIDTVVLMPGFDYDLYLTDDAVAFGTTFTLDASRLCGCFVTSFDGSAVTNGNLHIIGGAGDDYMAGGAGNDTMTGGLGNDLIYMGANLTAADLIAGGKDFDTLELGGDYSAGITLGPTYISGIEQIVLDLGFDYHVVLQDGMADSSSLLSVGSADPYSADPGHSLYIDGSALTAPVQMIGSDNGDTLIAGGPAALIGAGGADTMEGGDGTLFFYSDSSESTGSHYDTIIGFDALSMAFAPTFAVSGVDTAVTHGSLSTATFDTDLASDINNAQLARSHAVLFTPDGGDLAGKMFLIIDQNDTKGYQAGADIVIYLDTPSHMAFFGTGDFI